jgi:hypothetical protein
MNQESKEKADAWYWFVVGFMFRGENKKSQNHKVTREKFEKNWKDLNSDNFI